MENKIIIRDLSILLLSLIIGIFLSRSGIIKHLLIQAGSIEFLGILISGIFYTSGFTIIPASFVLGQLTINNSILEIALIGAIGAVIGDVIIFKYFRDFLTDDLLYIVRKFKGQTADNFNHQYLRYFNMIIGALILASPIPDEVGLALMGFSRLKSLPFICIVFPFKFVGIYAIALAMSRFNV